MNISQKNDKGFILVTTLVLLGMLGMLGASAAWKTSVETKVSGLSAQASQALAVASSGIQKQFYEWTMDATIGSNDGDRNELTTLIAYIADVTAPGAMPAIYLPAATVSNIDDFSQNIAGGNIDAFIQNPLNGIRVYEMQAAGLQWVANANWDGGTTGAPQVAIWATSFVADANPQKYPYLTPNTTRGCENCSLVLYALGAHNGVQRLVRQKVSSIDKNLYGVSAMTNAPRGKDYNEMCVGSSGSGASSNVTPWDPTVTGPGGNGSLVIEATQAVYKLLDAPSGNAIVSNTVLGTGGKGFRKDLTSETGASFASTPYIVYSGHGTATGVKVDWADAKHDVAGVDLPAGLLPKNLIAAPLMGGDGKLEFFNKPEEQLFSMPAYRWAAEQFTCQTLSWPPVPAPGLDGTNGNGLFCSKGEALRRALQGMGYTPRAPVTGRLTLAEFQYNIANNIPMFGMVRVMFPAEPDGNVGPCGALHIIEQPGNAPGGADFNKLKSTAAGEYLGTAPGSGGTASVVLDIDGDLGPTARLIVYGSLLIDYFADYPIEASAIGGAGKYNAVFDANGGERFLKPTESPDVYLAIEHNIMINPVMPNFGGGDPQAFPTAARQNLGRLPNAAIPSRVGNATNLNVAANNILTTAGQINMVDLNNPGDPAAGNRVHLASPYDGYFPWAEGLVPRLAGVGRVGTMRLMSRSTLGLVTAMQNIEKGGGQPVAMPTGDLLNLLNKPKPRRFNPPLTNPGKEANVLEYHYRLMVESILHSLPGKQPDEQSWPVAGWPGDHLFGDFYMGKEDQANGNNDGDKLHLMFPSGYPHGWKVALAALDMSADEWNNILSGGDGNLGISDPLGLYAQIQGNCGGAACPRGWPMSLHEPEFATVAAVAAVERVENAYFYITPDQVTGYGRIDADWRDIPSTMYSGGLLDMHAHSNMNGIIYTPGPLEWEPGNSVYDAGKTLGHLSYVAGSIITGYGQYTKNVDLPKSSGTSKHRYVLVFDKQAVDNVTVRGITVILRKHAWQELR